jgi:hypothetical protein
LQFVTLLVKLKLGLFHEFFMLIFDVINLITMSYLKQINIILDLVISLKFIVDLLLMVLFELCDLLIVSFLFVLQLF